MNEPIIGGLRMPKHFFRRLLPSHAHIRDHRHLRWLGEWLHDPNLFHLNRRSAAGGVAAGVFVAFIPTLGQMAIAALIAIFFRVNLPLAVLFVWVSNPLTIPPMIYAALQTGSAVLGRPMLYAPFEPTLEWVLAELERIWAPLLLGGAILGLAGAAASYLVVRGLWRLAVLQQLRRRRQRTRRQRPG
ncbi:DUF2062 domain-containing protein [Thiohalospira sp.]|uniref:DUF2062 domain-containing protein n=1 Tax=Thiohalospira sp. TaxID=3080549 RepID=UPI0039811439